MSTLELLLSRRDLIAIDGELDDDELPERYLFAYPDAVEWLSDILPSLETDGFFQGALRPIEQIAALIHDFVSGLPSTKMPPHRMTPEEKDIWELRTHDVRFFGWFYKKSVFIISSVNVKSKCIGGYYGGHLNQALYRRNTIDLDEPKFITGDLKDVL